MSDERAARRVSPAPTTKRGGQIRGEGCKGARPARSDSSCVELRGGAGLGSAGRARSDSSC
eukprot:4555751-Prymnesium_polylepis.1